MYTSNNETSCMCFLVQWPLIREITLTGKKCLWCYSLHICYNFHCFSRKFTLQQNFVNMHREIMNHNTHINHAHLQALIELPIATVYNNTGLSKMYGPFLINHLWIQLQLRKNTKGAHRSGHSINSNPINTVIRHWIMMNSVWGQTSRFLIISSQKHPFSLQTLIIHQLWEQMGSICWNKIHSEPVKVHLDGVAWWKSPYITLQRKASQLFRGIE